ncbi:MAG TPA: hypothetical protein VNI01_15195 [Elusimicrobiota bacterium]|jgi:tetratricopeptide (TPR) repeat protein|nr:hypothetical protein [Elusimicrobiota bacterium]
MKRPAGAGLRPPARVYSAAAAGLALAVFLPALHHQFVGFDDGGHIYANPCLHPPSWGNAARFFLEPYNGIYMPLVFALWSALAALAGWARGGPVLLRDVPALFHGANLVIHALNSALVCELLLAAPGLRRKSPWLAFAGAALFAVHPLHVEPVAWASGMKDLLSGFFFLLSLRVYLLFAERGFRSKPLYVACLAAYGLSMFAKPSGAAWPFVVLALDLWVFRRRARAAVVWAGFAALLSLPFAALNSALQPTTYIGTLTPVWTRPLVALDALAFYLAKLFVPLELLPDYGRTPAWVVASGRAYWTWLLPAALAAGLLRVWGAGETLAGAALFAAALLPNSGLLPFQNQIASTVADRYAYLAILGASWTLAHLLRRARAPGAAAAALAIAACALLSRRQLRYWRDTEALARRVVEANPESVTFQTAMGSVEWVQGRTGPARARYAQALRLRPTYYPARERLGLLDLAEGRLEDARREFRACLGSPNPADAAMAQTRLAQVALREGRVAEARRRDLEALRLRPRSPEALADLARTLEREGAGAARIGSLASELRPAFVCAGGPPLDLWPARIGDSAGRE